MALSSKPAKKDVKTKADSPPASTNGTTTPISSANDGPSAPTPTSSAKPDKKAYEQEQEALKSEIDAAQAALTAVKDKIGLTSKSGPGRERRDALRKELEDIRGTQSQDKRSRDKIKEQLRSIQESYQKKIATLNAAKGKSQFKTVADADERIRQLEKQVESGSMKLADEKRALQEITQCKRVRKNLEGFQKDEESIQADRHAADELRKQLDDPEAKALHDRYDAIQKELDVLKEEDQVVFAGRNKLFEERERLQTQVNDLWTKKKASSAQYREANDRHWAKIHEDRARRAEKARAQRAAEEAEKKKAVAVRLREEAESPAYQAQIEDCQTLIDYFSGNTSGTVKLHSAPEKAELVGVPKLDIRQVEAPSDGLVARKKKGEDEEDYFVGTKGKKRKGPKSSEPKEANGSASATGALNVPLPTLSALLTLAIPPPSDSADVPRVVEDLKTKKAWFEANQARVTAENIAKAEANIKRLLSEAEAAGTEESAHNGEAASADTADASEKLDDGAHPVEA